MKRSTSWRMVRVPVELASRLDTLADQLHRSHVEGRSQLPAAYVDHVPLHHVIDRAVGEMEAHRERSRRPKPRRSGDVYIPSDHAIPRDPGEPSGAGGCDAR